MTDVLGTLVSLFARNQVDEITNGVGLLVNEFRKADNTLADYDAIKKLRDYDKKFGCVLDAKRQIEDIEKRNSGKFDDQAIACLIWLKRLREKSAFRTEEYNVARELVGKSLYQQWPPADQQAFDERVAVFDRWTDFFISYTNRDSLTTNNRYKSMISHHYRWPGTAEAAKINYVARVIVKLLEQLNIHGFADYKTLRCGDDIPDEILQHCQSTFAFVQLIEDVTFAEPPPEKMNWCFEEYHAFRSGISSAIAQFGLGNRCFFTLAGAEELTAYPNLPLLYAAWHREISNKLHIVLDKSNTKPFDKLRLEVLDVADQIVKGRAHLVESMLTTWP